MKLVIDQPYKNTLRQGNKAQFSCSLIHGGREKKIEARKDIRESWQRCSVDGNINTEHLEIPSEDKHLNDECWKKLNLEHTAKNEFKNIKQLAKEGSYIAAISDLQGTLLWTYTSQQMRKKAGSVQFTRGRIWNEESAGTNAIGLSLKLKKPMTVLASEHWFSSLHDMVGYAAPIINPKTQNTEGILSFYTTSDRHSVLGEPAVIQLAGAIALHLPKHKSHAKLEINALGIPKVNFLGKKLLLSQRQIEILCLLALNPEGQYLDELHGNLYGDQNISKSTLKAEISHLRKLLGGGIGSRPYRLTVDTWCDFIAFWNLRDKDKDKDKEIISLYRGSFLPKTNSPVLEEWQRCIDMVMGETTQACQDVALLTETMCRSYSGYSLIQKHLFDLSD